jgi:formylglycine-generating enzyme required for sulfatase activity
MNRTASKPAESTEVPVKHRYDDSFRQRRAALCLVLLTGAAVALAGACVNDPGEVASVPPTTSPPDSGVFNTSDAQSDAVAPIALPSQDPTCAPGEPTSCCFGRKKYGGTPGADTSCGPNGDEDCCAYDALPGGTFNRMNDPALPATVPAFKLGRYLITTARFKVWMQEGGGLASKAPSEGAGAHPTLPYPQSGWRPEWTSRLARTPAELAIKVYTDPSSDGWGCTLDYYPQKPNYPVDCIDYYLMNAFCAWDGGYAITETMWEYAARGGTEQRPYAWGKDAPVSLDTSVFCLSGGGTWGIDLWCTNPANPAPLNVGSSKNGRGKWGTFDLMGNLMNMTIDEAGPMPPSCTNDCIIRPAEPTGLAVARGIAFHYPNNFSPEAYANMIATRPVEVPWEFNGSAFGFRCAYPESWPTK